MMARIFHPRQFVHTSPAVVEAGDLSGVQTDRIGYFKAALTLHSSA